MRGKRTVKAAIGVDIGGTSLKFAVVDQEGRVLRERTAATPSHGGANSIMSEMLAGIDSLLADMRASAPDVPIEGIGIGAAGQIDAKDGSVAFAVDTIPGWTGTPIRRLTADRFPALPVYVDNDVNVLALAEKYYGAGKNARHFVCVALGTGIGGAIVQDGAIVHGAYGGAGELGHLSVDFNGPRCSCGNFGCLELYASGSGIHRLLADMFDGLSPPAWELNAAGLLSAWERGDAAAAEVMDVVLGALGSAFASIIHALNPEAIIVGGGMLDRVPALLPAIERATAPRTSPAMWKHVKLLPALSGNRSGVIGAAAQVWHHSP